MIETEELLEKLELTTLETILDEYADMDDKEIRRAVALNPYTSKDTMFRRLYFERDECIRKIWNKKCVHWYKNKKHHMDVKLGDETIRFYPKSSSVHGFGYECPKSWNNYYKEYLSFAILYQDEYMKECKKAPEIVFKCRCDECSSLLSLNCYLYLWLQDTQYKNSAKLTNVTLKNNLVVKDDTTLYTLGDGTEWKIKRDRLSCISDKDEETDESVNRWSYTIIPYLNYGAQKAYVLELNEKELLVLNNGLAEYLDECIKNSESI